MFLFVLLVQVKNKQTKSQANHRKSLADLLLLQIPGAVGASLLASSTRTPHLLLSSPGSLPHPRLSFWSVPSGI